MRTSGFGLTRSSMNIMSRRRIRKVRMAKMKNTSKFKAYKIKCRMLQTYRKQKLKEKEGVPMGPVNFSCYKKLQHFVHG